MHRVSELTRESLKVCTPETISLRDPKICFETKIDLLNYNVAKSTGVSEMRGVSFLKF